MRARSNLRQGLLVPVALAGALASQAGQAVAADRYANQEVSYAKPDSQPSTDQIQSPRDAASGQANGAKVTFPDILISSATTPSNPPRQSNLGDTATHEIGHAVDAPVNAQGGANPNRPDNFSLSSSTPGSTAVGRTETVNNNEGIAGAIGEGASDVNARSRKPHRNRNGARGKRMHKP